MVLINFIVSLFLNLYKICTAAPYLIMNLEAFFSAVIKVRTDYENLNPATIGVSKMK